MSGSGCSEGIIIRLGIKPWKKFYRKGKYINSNKSDHFCKRNPLKVAKVITSSKEIHK